MIGFKKVDKLVAISVLSAVALAWGFIVGLDALITFLKEMNDVGTGTYTASKAVIYELLTLPRRAYEWFADSALIGGLIGMGMLASSGELTALRAAGLSKFRICLSVIFSLTVLTGIVTLMGETIGPRGEQKAEQLQLTAKSKDVSIGKAGANWARDGNTIVNAKHSRRRVINGAAVIELSDVRVFEFTDRGQLAVLSIAATAVHDGKEWVLHDVRRTDFNGGTAKTTEQKEAHWKSELDPNVLALSVTHPDNMSAIDLQRNIEYMRRNHQDATPYEKAYWGRVFYPFNVLVLAFCAVPFAFGALRTGGLGKRLFIGMALAISYYFVQRSVVNMGAVYNFNMAVANALPFLLLAAAAFVYFRRHA